MDKVKLDSGYISGFAAGQPDREISIFRGIPYAAPPVGDLRWKPPQPAKPWAGNRDCTGFSVQAAQYPDIHASETMKALPSSEDCLYLNVLTPAKSSTDKLPVMVWFHGGGTRYGNGNLPISNSLGLPSHDVVLVTTNHRLGILGLLAHPMISAESPQGASGNYLFLDLIASLQWVQKNIAAFGGDPDNVTIFGRSGGGLKVAALMASPLAKGLFHRAIVQSGGRSFEPAKLEEVENYGEQFFAKLGVADRQDPLTAAREVPCERILEAEQAFNVDLGPEYLFMGPWSINEDGWFMPDSILNLFRSGDWNRVPYLLLSDLGELTGPGLVIADTAIANYLILLNTPTEAGSPGYAIVFDRVPDNWRKEGCVSAHGMELHYMFGSLDVTEAWEAHAGGFALAGAKSPMPILTDVDRAVSENMVTIWTRFARTGNPSVPGVVEWPAWQKDSDLYLYVNESFEIKAGYSALGTIEPIRIGVTL